MKRRLREKGKEWRGAKNDMDAKMRDVESKQAFLLQQVKVTMTECKRAALFMDDRVDIIGEGEVKDLSGWIRTSLEHIQDGNEGMLDQVEHVSNSLLDTMINLQDRLAEDPDQQLGVVQKRMDQLDQCIRLLQGSGEDQDQVPTRGLRTRDADTQTETRGQDDFTQTETRGQENFTQTDRQEQEDLAQPELLGEVDQRVRQVADGRFQARLLPWGLVGLLLVLLVAVALSMTFQSPNTERPIKLVNVATDDSKSEESAFESEIATKITPNNLSDKWRQESVVGAERTGIHVETGTKTLQTEEAQREHIMSETRHIESHAETDKHEDRMNTPKDQMIEETDDQSDDVSRATDYVRGWMRLCSVVLVLMLSLPALTLIIKRCLTPTREQLTETVLVLLADVSTQTPSDYRIARVSVIDVTELVDGITHTFDTAACPVTGRVYVCGRREGDYDRVLILVFDRDMTFITHVTTDIHTGGYFPYISVSPAGELLVTAMTSSQISFLDGAGRLVRRVETRSRCGRCVSDGHRLYVCHPYRGCECVTVLDDQGQQIRQIGGAELREAEFLTIHESHLYVTDPATGSLHVYSTSGYPVRRISTAGRVTEIQPRGVHVDSAGHVLPADRKNKCIHVYGKDGSWIHTLTDDRIGNPRGLTQTAEGGLVLANPHPPALFMFKPHY